ncbi:DEAD/DEAH box helicase, variant [Blastomyces gilchristii SLH14081]|uniref:DEAD/DEAH box helicase n=1 Tax=Blastomyces gilchristii (strain SLH14081) TaxID=559298 RepID=A0A179UUE6_BLAGS|nr:DEAD/DEAH box helicase [Blastomyces gilchristii SLH14081]XP_031579976.1 DEAD/DEAH box helicase, variant [Blastomyces gilchristii SLH14081]OAT11664.1 DEAD/DEAH box helicase [Blastomyces gilchristii SLH14081]OAT11665.1 DEAD/DEAH box helicase, variant [Blastomyces gilchristii SLH14081]
MGKTQALLNWYASLKSRNVDLVGDYAGDELFFIEGDSLLAHTFADEKLDLNPGFQLLHATYMIENFLRGLHQRKCTFHIVFFEEHAKLCIPPNMPDDLHPRCLLAREAMIQHLQSNVGTQAPPIEIKVFDSYEANDFKSYLAASGAYFIMCHDGAFANIDSRDDSVASSDDEDGFSDGNSGMSDDNDDQDSYYTSDEDMSVVSSDGTRHAIGFRSMINWFICLGYNVGLLNSLECRDTKVMAMIMEGTAKGALEVSLHTFITNKNQTNSPDMEHVDDEESDSGSEPDSDSLDDTDTNEITTKEFTKLDLNASSFLEANAASNPQDLKFLQEFRDTLTTSACQDLTQSDLAVVMTLSLMYKSGAPDGNSATESEAMLLHTAIIHECRLSDRAVNPKPNSGEDFFTAFIRSAYLVLKSDSWKAIVEDSSLYCDLADLLDGRIFFHLLSGGISQDISKSSVISKFESLTAWVEQLCGMRITSGLLNSAQSDKPKKPKNTKAAAIGKEISRPVLPFRHPVFDAHLGPVRLTIDKSHTQGITKKTSRIFQELSHWHNHRRPLGVKITGPKMTEKQAFFANRRNQFFMAEMADYAASLTNATGGILKPETVFVQSGKDEKQKKPAASKPTIAPRPKVNEKKGPAKSSGKRNPTKDLATAANEKKKREMIDKQLQAWAKVKATFDKESDLAIRFTNVKKYLAERPSDSRVTLEAEVSTYMLSILVQLWINRCTAGERDRSLHIAAFIWDMVCRIAKIKEGVTPEIAAYVKEAVKALRLPDIDLGVQPSRKSSQATAEFSLLESAKKGTLDIGLSPTEFQLSHAAPFFDRNMDSAPDSRVRDFEPDAWQRQVLDEIDGNRSLFVVAPTSAGKTFISFYAMKRILEDDDNSVLVYVAPTKALVNQVAAEIQARFSKSFKHGGKSVWGIHTRDYRINNPTGCQVLVTVPHILQIMLLAPANASSWSSRVKRIIFDEIHCIGQVEEGVVWEQLLLLAPCPIIALSATVGNPQAFSNWLNMTQKANGIDLTMIEHRHRYSDLRKYVYKPPKKFHFNGLPDSVPFAPTSLDNAFGMAFMHPVACIVDRLRGMPEDLTLEARDCWLLWNAMKKYQTADFPVPKSLDPAVALPDIIRKVDIVNWEAELKPLLKSWIADPKSPFDLVLKELESPVRSAQRPDIQISSRKPREAESSPTEIRYNYLETTLPLICSLQEQGGLPALFFNYDRSGCEAICEKVLTELEAAEEKWKELNPVWKAKVAAWEAWKTAKEKQAKKAGPADAKKGKKGNDQMTREERMRDTATAEPSAFESFEPDAPLDGFHLADVKKLTPSEFEEHAKELRRRYVPERLITALRRGIGVHHAGMNRKYRQLCEILFRKGYLRVVIATGTLALGINMPCKTVVFSGDSIFLTALNFRQAAGRAGRRGFDVLGNVVFQALPYSKICRLLSSRLPGLHGHFPITTSLVLRLFTLLYESKQAPNAVKMINSLLSCPHIYLGGGEARDSVLHHLRFSIEFLRRNHLLGPDGAPLNFAGCVSHLYFVENSSFAFHSLLKDGYFHNLCRDLDTSRKQKILTLMLIMSHLFGRRHLRPSVLEHQQNAVKKSTSIIVLPPLPKRAATVLRRNNKEILKIYSTYVKTFVDQHITEPDHKLPLTGMKCGGDAAVELGKGTPPSPAKYTSAFYALSGHHDEWSDISDLCQKVRGGVWLEKAVVPYLGLPEEDNLPLNAYLYDFFKHGNIDAIERDNDVRKGDIWFLLNDFSMVLATIVTSLENFLKLTPGTDADAIDVMGSGEMYEGEVDVGAMQDGGLDGMGELGDVGVGVLNRPIVPTTAASTPAPTTASKPRRKKVVDSWEDEDVEDNGDNDGNDGASKGGEFGDEDPAAPWDGKDRGGIFNVLKGFKLLREEFDMKFREMWA